MKYEQALVLHRNLLHGNHMSTRLIRDVICNPQQYWRKVEIPKRNGDTRICYSPSENLRVLQSRIMKYVRKKIYNNWNSVSHWKILTSEGFGYQDALALSKGCGQLDSIVQNAWYHSANMSSLVLDLKDAFASIRTKHVYRFLRKFIADELAWTFSRVLTFEGRIRQGAPISQELFDFLMERFDRRLALTIGAPLKLQSYWGYLGGRPLPKIAGFVYTRYGDDLCFSFPGPEFPVEVETQIRSLVVEQGLRLNRKRLVGKCGFLPLPGVQVVHGRIQPSLQTIERMNAALEEGDLWRVQGYRNYLHQFPRSGRKKAYKIARKIAVSG